MSTTTLTPPAAVQPLEGGLVIPLSLMTPSPLNPRKHWKQQRVDDMAASLRAVGQVQPVRVRANPQYTDGNGRPPYEIVVGETRWRAAPAAGLGVLEAILGTYTDLQVVELALAENTKRGDLHPLEEADAYAALMRDPDGLHGYPTVQELAAHVGASPSYIYQRLKLRALCATGREAFLAGRIDASVALLIARMPDATEQARATARIVAGFGGEAYSYRQAAEFLQREFMLRLSLARFDIGATYGVAGPCVQCPKRSGAEPDLFADVTTGDMCQDARCYQAKAEEAHQALLTAARDAGRTVLQGSAARAVLPAPGATPVGHYRLDAPCPELSDSGRPLRAILGKGFAQQIVVVDLPDTAPVELVTADAARQALKARGLLRAQTTGNPVAKPGKRAAGAAADAEPSATAKHSPSGGAQAHTPGAAQATAAADAEPNADGKATETASAKAATTAPAAPVGGPKRGGEGQQDDAKAEEQRKTWRRLKFGQLLASELSAALEAVPDLGLAGLRLAVQIAMDGLSAEALRLLAVVRGWVEWEHIGGISWYARIERAEGRELGELLVLLQVIEQLSDGQELPGLDDDVRTLCEAYGLLAGRTWYESQIATSAGEPPSAAGCAGSEQDATDAFLRQHATGSTEAPAEAAAEAPAWPWPGDEAQAGKF